MWRFRTDLKLEDYSATSDSKSESSKTRGQRRGGEGRKNGARWGGGSHAAPAGLWLFVPLCFHVEKQNPQLKLSCDP